MLTSRATYEKQQRLVELVSSRGPIISRDGLIEVYRGLRDVEGANLSMPGKFWSLSIKEASKYAIPEEPIHVRDEGSFYFGHLLSARIPIDFGNASCALGQLVDLMIGKRIENPQDKRDLFEVFVPLDQCALLKDVSLLYSIKSPTFDFY